MGLFYQSLNLSTDIRINRDCQPCWREGDLFKMLLLEGESKGSKDLFIFLLPICLDEMLSLFFEQSILPFGEVQILSIWYTHRSTVLVDVSNFLRKLGKCCCVSIQCMNMNK